MLQSLPYSVSVDRDFAGFLVTVGYALQDDFALWTVDVLDDLGESFGFTGQEDGAFGSVSLDLGLGAAGPERVYTVHFTLQGPVHFDRYTYDWTVRVGFQAIGAVSYGGTTGADILIGGAFDDQLFGLADADFLDGGAGNDTMVGGSGDDTYSVADAADLITEALNEGFDQVFSSASYVLDVNIENLTLTGLALTGTGNAGANLIIGNALNNRLTGGDGADTLRGEAGADSLFGGTGADTLDGGTGGDTLAGGDGDDIYLVQDPADRVIEVPDQGQDTVLAAVGAFRLSAHVENLTGGSASGFAGFGNELDNIITSGRHDDRLWGLGGADVLDAGDGNDLLSGGAGADILIGGQGRDVDGYLDAVTAVTVNLLTGTGTRGDAESDRYVDIESAVGGGANDLLVGNEAVNVLIGGAGQDRILGGGGADMINGGIGRDFLFGDAGFDTVSFAGMAYGVIVTLGQAQVYNNISGTALPEDVIAGFENVVGTAFADVIRGDAGANILAGGAGADMLRGGAGSDTLSYAGSVLAVTVNLATQTVSGGDAAGDVVAEFEHATGGMGADILTGHDLANQLSGGAGADTIFGGLGDDMIRGGSGADLLFGGSGSDTISFADATDGAAIFVDLTTRSGRGGDAEGDRINGFENVIGSAATDYITGSAQANRIYGGAGFDIIVGGAGNDLLSGGGNGNQFYFSDGFGQDVITDFDTDAVGGHDVMNFDIVTLGTFDLIMATARASGGQGQNLTFHISPTDSLTLLNVSAAELLPVHLGFSTDL